MRDQFAVQRGGEFLAGPTASRSWWILGIVALTWFLVLLDDTAVTLAVPSLARDLTLGTTGAEWIVNSYTLAFAVLTLPGGALTDRLGTRPVFLGGLSIFAAGSLIAALSTSSYMLITARMTQGAGAALLGPATLAVLLSTFTGRRRGFALGVWAGVGATALAGGPLIGAVITGTLGWQWIFLINVPAGILMGIFAARALPAPTLVVARHGLDVAGFVLSAIGLSSLIYGLTEASNFGWTSAQLWAILALSGVSLVAFFAIESRVATPLLDPTLLRLPNFLAANILGLLNLAVMCSVFFFLSLYLQAVAGASPIRAGISLLPLTVTIALVAPAAGWLVTRVGARWLIAAGMVILAMGLLLIARIQPTWGLWQLLPGLLLTGLGIGMSTSPVTTAAMEHVPIRLSGVASGSLNAFRMVGLSLGIAVMGAIVVAQSPSPLTPGIGQSLADRLGTGLIVNALLAIAAAALALILLRTQTPGADSTAVIESPLVEGGSGASRRQDRL